MTYVEMVGKRGIGLPIVEAVSRYRRPLGLDDEFAVDLRVCDLSRRGLTTEFRFRRTRDADGEPASDGHIRRRFVDMEAFRPTELPDDLHAAFARVAAGLRAWPAPEAPA